MSNIAAIATGSGIGGISIIRISGNNAIKIADKVFKSNFGKTLKNMKGYTATLGKIYKNKKLVDEVVALVFRAPNSYTGEDVVEFSCHGGNFVTKEVLGAVLEAGANMALPGEFTKRAFLNKKIDLTKAESIMNLISAQGQQSLDASLRVFEGNIFKKISKIKNDLSNLMAKFSASLDYNYEDIEEFEKNELLEKLNFVKREFECLINNFEKGRIIKDGLRIAIVGKTNTGKSTLMNLLSGHNRSIVTNIAGTTRDTIEESINLNGIALCVVDTAGIRNTNDPIEKIGIKKSYEELNTADLILAVFDSSKSLCNKDLEILENIKNRKTLVIINKTDLPSKIEKSKIYTYFKKDNIIEFSLKNKKNFNLIEEKILKIVELSDLEQNQDFLANKRQLLCAKASLKKIDKAINLLIADRSFDIIFLEIEEAIENICKLTGEKTSQIVIDKIFSDFCVGK